MGQTFDKTFKQEAVRLVQTSGKSQRQVAEDLGVAMSTLRYCQLMKIMEELVKKKDEGKKRSRRRGADNAVLCRSFCSGDLIPLLESALQKGTVLPGT